jgi:D-aspartate ligase
MQDGAPLQLESWNGSLDMRSAASPVTISSRRWSSGQRAGGVILLGGDCSAVGVGRALAPLGLEVRFLPGPNRLASFSRYLKTVADWPGAEAEGALAWLESYAMNSGAAGWVLIPAGDSEVRLVTNHHERLSRSYRLATPPWQVTRFAADKQLTYARCAELGIGHPRTYRVPDLDAAGAAELFYPVILKPAMKEGVNALTISKAWRADDRSQFLSLYADALPLAGMGGVIVQELIPDDGNNQFSYAAFCENGEPRVVMAAQRVRQRPRKAGTGTYVRTLATQAFEADAETFLRSLNYTGLVEIEFMRDPRDGSFRLIDVNPRIWTWHALGLAAGVNFARAVWQSANGMPVSEGRAAPGYTWLYALRDLPVAIAEIADGNLGAGAYLKQLLSVSSLATFSFADPLPALADLPISLGRRLRR